MQMRSDIVRYNDKHGAVKLCLVDYLQQMHSGTGHRDRREEVSFISRALKDISMEFGMAIVAASAMNREFERRQTKDKRPELADLNESGQIESDASVVLFPHRPSTTATANGPVPDDELVLRKNRHGPTGIVPVKFMGPYYRFENLN